MKKNLSDRQYIVKAIFIVVGAIFLIRLFYLQIIDGTYGSKADQNVLRIMTQYPARGLVYDREGQLLVYNEAIYDLMVIPRQVEKDLDTAQLCSLLGITTEDFITRMAKARAYSPYAPSIFEKQISKEDFGSVQEKLYRFKGFYAQSRTLRKYPKSIAAHILGYVGEVNDADIKKNDYYKQGDYIGKSGLEKSYEEVLRGRKGCKIIMVDSKNQEKGSFMDGFFDTLAISSGNLYATIDADLQEYGELLMKNKRGSIVAIEPATGEVLALVSAPTYDPNLLVGKRGAHYKEFQNDIAKPLFNRALMASYPPGSIFKVAQGMVGLELGVVKENTGFSCDKSLVGCHNHPNATGMRSAIKMSCNPYFYQVFKKIIIQNKSRSVFSDSQYGLNIWGQYMNAFGFGTRLPIDLPDVKRGRIPDTAFYNRWYGPNRWNFYMIYSLSIGQGEVEVVPLQMANLAAIVANRGYYYTPHLVRYWGDDKEKNPEFETKHSTGVRKEYFDCAAQGMYDVVHEPGGTGSRARIPDIVVCGKTGTAENIGQDHSVFVAFAPMNNPKIAISVYVENSGFGGTWAAPIASLMIEKYIKKEVKRKDLEKQMVEAKPCQSLPLVRKPKKIKKN